MKAAGWAPCTLLVLGLVAGCARVTVPPPLAPASPFIVTFWCAPPLPSFDDVRAAEVAAAGFTIVGPQCEGPVTPELNRQALDVAARHGLRMWIKDARFDGSAPERDDWKEQLATAVVAYRDHPALGGYFVYDEPSTSELAAVGSVVAALRAVDPAHLAYVNLLPDYVTPEVLGAENYDAYVARFVATVQPDLLSLDYYPFSTDQAGQARDRPTFFSSLATVREQAEQHHLPFMLIVQAMPHLHYRDPTEAELRWQVFHALAFGARGISYFAYWTPVDVLEPERMHFHNGLIADGKPTGHYFEAARVNRDVHALAAELAAYRSIVVADSVASIGPGFPIGPIEAIDGGAVTAGLFVSADAAFAALLVNRDYRSSVTADLTLRSGAERPEVFDPLERRWTLAETLQFQLAPGGARLLRWR